MQYGHFDDEKREYVITNPRTPVKWINYIGTLAFGGFVDHTGGALICKGDPTYNRITKYIPQLPASEFKGETLYLRIKKGADWQIFSPFFVPGLDALDKFECHVGLGYTRILSEYQGLQVDTTIFVPRGDAVEIRDIRVTNISKEPLEVDAIPVVEYTHPDALKQFTNADWVPQTMQSRAIRDQQGHTILIQYPFMFRETKVNYFTSNLPPASFESDRAKFLGEHEYGTWAQPKSLFNENLSETEALRGDNIAALLQPLGTLMPGSTQRLITQLGQEGSLEEAKPTIDKYRAEKDVDNAFKDLALFWEEYLSRIQVKTPDAALNSMLNIHNPRQTYITLTWSRYLSLYQLGLGSRGIGCRDSSQDVMGVLASAPGEAKELLRKLVSIQKRDGSAMHSFNPLTMEGSLGDAVEYEDRPQYYSDDHLWIILAVTAYLKETGDTAFLEEPIPFYEKDKSGQPLESGSVLVHLLRALDFTRKDTGAHGLPLLGFADWNDTVNLKKGAESLFTANLYGKALLEMQALMRFLGREDEVKRLGGDYLAMQKLVNDIAWDDEWFVRYFDFDGQSLGSSSNEYGRIYLNGQTWPVISGFASREKALQAMDSVDRLLNTRNGIKLSAPGFNGYDASRGGITTYPPGAKENGGIFVHTNPWAVIAETLLGRGSRAYEYYRQISPAARNDCIDEFESEPYAYPQNILSDEHPQFGLGRNAWLTGAASWAYQAGIQYILGVRPEYEGLRIDPCIPADWKSFKITRHWRGAVYHVKVENPNGVEKGVRLLTMNGKPVQNPIPLQPSGTFNEIIVEMM